MDVDVQSAVDKILAKAKLEKTIDVIKDIDLDLGNLVAFDQNIIEEDKIRSKSQSYLAEVVRDDVQLLVNALWKLPMEIVDNTQVVKLPAATTKLPREKPIPQPKKPTRWEEYAKLKGIQKRKKGRMTWDEQSKEWRPRWGYKRANDDSKDWMLEVPEQADPNEDQFEKRLKARKESVAKNELQRLRNIARHMKGKVPGVGLTPVEKPDKDTVSRALSVARTSTASLGKFTESLPKEKPISRGKKHKFEPNIGNVSTERDRAKNILRKLETERPILDAAKATNRLVAAEQMKRASAKRKSFGEPEESRGKKRKPVKSGNAAKSGKAGKGGKAAKGRTAGGKRRKN